MKTTLINNVEYLEFDGRLYRKTEESSDIITSATWAKEALLRENTHFPNGMTLHEGANIILDDAAKTLVQYLVVTA
jgi:hypothetical protein